MGGLAGRDFGGRALRLIVPWHGMPERVPFLEEKRGGEQCCRCRSFSARPSLFVHAEVNGRRGSYGGSVGGPLSSS